jgi:hypothetical protein
MWSRCFRLPGFEKIGHCLAVMAVMLLALPVRAVIVDRVAISAGNRIITDSEIRMRILLTAFENGVKPEFDVDSRKRAAEMLIDQKIVEREMDVGHYPRLSGDGRKQLLVKYDVDRKALEAGGLTATDLEEDLGRQADLLTFLSLRFRPLEDTNAANREDANLNAWLKDQRKRTKIDYLESELAP